MMKRTLSSAVLLSVFALLSCSSADEQDALAKAQKCLDEVPQSAPATASECLSYIDKYDSQQAKILKCSIYMTSGGLMENKILKAYQVSKDDTITKKEIAYLSILALDEANYTEGLTKANTGNTFCQESGVAGLKYLGAIIVNGTTIAKSIAAFGTTIDENSTPTQINNAVNTMINDCTGATPTAANCPSDAELANMGTAVATLATGYCANEDADEDVCEDVNEALAAAGSNSTYIGQALLCYMNNKTFNSSTGDCNP